MRLIDADALIEKLCGDCFGFGNKRCQKPCYEETLIKTMPTIEAEPIKHYDTETWKTTATDMSSVEYAPIKHGRWDIIGRCSNCGKYCGVRKPDYSYCPNCGALMTDEVESDTETLEMWDLDGSPTRYIKVAKTDEVGE